MYFFFQEDVEICDDWADLIEYVIQKFISTIGTRPHAYASNLLECINTSEAVDENGFTRSQLDHLYSYYTQFEDAPDPVGCVIELYKRSSNVTKTRLSVIQALLSQGIISLAQYMNMMYMKSVVSVLLKYKQFFFVKLISRNFLFFRFLLVRMNMRAVWLSKLVANDVTLKVMIQTLKMRMT